VLGNHRPGKAKQACAIADPEIRRFGVTRFEPTAPTGLSYATPGATHGQDTSGTRTVPFFNQSLMSLASPRELALLRKINAVETRWDTFSSLFLTRFRNECPTNADERSWTTSLIAISSSRGAVTNRRSLIFRPSGVRMVRVDTGPDFDCQVELLQRTGMLKLEQR
jgi:hypothetical protein